MKQTRSLFFVLLLFLGNLVLYGQCSVNAGGNAAICGTSYTLQGTTIGTPTGTPTWTIVTKPPGAPDPVFNNPNILTPTVTGMTFPGNYVFQVAQNCSPSGSGTSQVTITAAGATTGFTAGPDITGISAITGVATLNATIPAGYTPSWTYYNIYNYETTGTITQTNATLSNPATATPTLTLDNKANHGIDPAYRAVLRITSIYNSNCWYEDDAIVRFVPNPDVLYPATYSQCVTPGTTGANFFYEPNSGSPKFSTSTANSSGNIAFGTTVTMAVVSQPSGGNIQYSRLADNGRLYFSGITATGDYVFDLTISNTIGTFTKRLTYTFSGYQPGFLDFIDPAYPNQMEIYTNIGSAGSLYCNRVGTTTPITFNFQINAVDPPTTTTTVTSSGQLPGGVAVSSIVQSGAGTMNRSVTLTPPSGGWRAGTYKFDILVVAPGGCNRRPNFYVHISDNARPAVNVDNITVCYPGSGVVSATVPLPAIYKTTVANPSYFQDLPGRYDFTLVSAPAGAATPTYEAAANRSLTSASTIISNLNKAGEYVFKIKATGTGGPELFLNAEYACAGTSLEDTFSVFVSGQVGANAGSSQNITTTQTTLNGNNPGVATGAWTLVTKPAGANDPVITSPSLYNSGVTGMTSSGTYTFRWTVTTGACVSASDTNINVTINNCVTGCNPNTFVNSVDPNTLEYDNMVSAYHASIVKESNGIFKVWGQDSQATGAGDLLAPTVVGPTSAATPTTNFVYTGTALKATVGSGNGPTTISHQFALLTTDGLYVWGVPNMLISSSIKNTNAFGKITVNSKTDGLPAGVTPQQVKMMFGSFGTLAIVTCSGEAWVLSTTGSKNGDGSTQNSGTPNSNTVWHRVKTSATTDLNGVVAMRGTANALFALTSDSKLYTWGTGTYINSGTAAARTYATEVTVPTGATPKMIGMTESVAAQSYYLLATNGKLYAMGDNSTRQLGDGTTAAKTTWVQPQKMTDQNGQGTGVLENIAWISPNEHSNYPFAANSTGCINVLTNTNKQWAWGRNDEFMIGGAAYNGSYDPMYMPGNSLTANGMKVTDEIIAVETGGHTSVNIKKGENKFGYVGHRTNGSMGDGSSANDNAYTYTYNTATVSICAAEVGPAVQDLTICNGTTANLNNANLQAIPSEVEWHATNSATSPVIADVTAVSVGTYYAFYTVASGKQRVAASASIVSGVVCCTTGDCNPNTYVNSTDPNTIEYDNIVSTFHSTIIKDSNGGFKVWGEETAPNGSGNLLSPTAITPANGFAYTGTPLKATGGMGSTSDNFHQHALLTTDGLYVWGIPNQLISSSIKSTNAFGKIAVNGKNDGLPPGVIPGQVKMMFGSYGTLAITTCSGEAWVLSFSGAKNGDGTAQDATNNVIWHRVKTSAAGNPDLDNVVALRGNHMALFALTSTGNLYTWGTNTYINSGAAANRTYATQVTVPAGVTPKMIGMPQGLAAGQSYYLLATDGRLYSMGNNAAKQLGDGTTVAKTTWVQPQKPAGQGQGTGNLTNVAWISPNEHFYYSSYYLGAINVLTNDRKMWAWGMNDYYMIGGSTAGVGTGYDPIYMPGNSAAANGMKVTDDIIAVETSGHTTMNIKKDDNRFGYVGHYINGSMGNGVVTDSQVSTYSYQTAIVTVCGAEIAPLVQNLQVCDGTTANLNNANLEATPAEVEWHATNSAASPVITNITAVAAGTYYAFFTVASGKQRTLGSAAIVSYYASIATPTVNAAVANNCPATTANLNTQAHTGLIPAGSTLVWFTNSTHTGAAYATPTAAGAGTYYAFYQDSVNGCYSQASAPVTVTINACTPCTVSTAADPMPVDLAGITVAAAPSGSVIQWHNSATPSAATLLSSTVVMATATPTNYWVYYYDSANGGCYSPGSKATVVSNACCTYPTVNLTTVPHATTPSGAQLVWYTTSGRLAGTKVNNPTAVGDGMYWLFFYDAASNTYTPEGTPVLIGVDNVCNVPCYKPGATTGTALDTKVGITSLGRAGEKDADNWPMARKGGWIALESKTKGFVPNRVAFSGGNPVGIAAANFVEGMMVYDITNKCLKVYTQKDGDTTMAWHCVTTQACPD